MGGHGENNGTINDLQDILKENGLESGSGKPVISINNTKEINIWAGYLTKNFEKRHIAKNSDRVTDAIQSPHIPTTFPYSSFFAKCLTSSTWEFTSSHNF